MIDAVETFGLSTQASASDNVLALQGALNSGGRIVITGPGTYLLNAELDAPLSFTELILEKGVKLKWTSLGTGKSGIKWSGSTYFLVEGGTLEGPSSGVYVANERAISAHGVSSSSRKFGFKVRDVEIKNFGSDAIFGQFVDHVRCRDNNIHDCGHSGAMFLSCNDGKLSGNTIDNITPGSSGNMYGISLTHDSTGYSGGGKQASNPFCRGWTVDDNEVSRIAWEGIDCHGAYEVTIDRNRVYATKMGISGPSSSGDAANYAGYQNKIINNVVDGYGKDGLSAWEGNGYGINLNGGATVNNLRLICTGNILRGKGIKANSSSGAIQAIYCTNAIIGPNVIDEWNGSGICFSHSSGALIGNIFGAMLSSSGETVGRCINIDGGSGKQVSLVGNAHQPGAGSAANHGVYLAGLSAPLLHASGNNFEFVTVSVLGGSAYSWTGDNFGNTITASIDDATPSVKRLQSSTTGTINVYSSAPLTITAFDDSFDGQVLHVRNVGSFNVTLSRAALGYFEGSVDAVLTPNDMVSINKSGAYWYQASKVINNG